MSMLTREEQGVLRHYIILSIARQVVENDLQLLEQTALKLQKPYLEFTKSILDQISREMATLKKFMTKHQMKIEKKQSDKMFTEYYYRSRGYEGINRILNNHLKHQVFSYILRSFPIEKGRLSKTDG